MGSKTKKPLTLGKPELITLPQEEAHVFERQIAAADKEHSSTSGIVPVQAPADGAIYVLPPRPVYKRIECNDFTFVFKYETGDLEMLHIYARHLTTAEDAIGIFFSYDPIWNAERKRFETYSETHGLYWFWRDEEKKVVMVTSCFKCERAAVG